MGEPVEAELTLRVLAREPLSEHVIRLVLGHRDGRELPPWQPGAHIDLIRDELVRQYSLTGDPQQADRWELAVRRPGDSQGGGSWVYTRLLEGAEVRVRGPRNHFPMHPGEEYLLIAGGIGITPLFPMALTAARAGARWRLIYGASGRGMMAYLDELSRLADEHSSTGRVDVLPEDEFGLLPLSEIIGPPRPGVQIYCCGPEGLLQAVEAACAGWPAQSLHVERYAARKPVATPADPAAVAQPAEPPGQAG